MIITSNEKYSKKYSIKIYKNRIIEYDGVTNNSLFESVNGIPKIYKINTSFDVSRLDKYQRIENNIDVKYRLHNEKLEFILVNLGLYLDLTAFEYFKIKWHNKKYLIQSKEIKTDILKYLIGGILGFCGALLIQYIKDYKNSDKKSPQTEKGNQ